MGKLRIDLIVFYAGYIFAMTVLAWHIYIGG